MYLDNHVHEGAAQQQHIEGNVVEPVYSMHSEI